MATGNERYVNYLKISTFWKRPEGPPRIWRVVDGRRKTASGETSRFSIQEVPKELEETVVDFMMKYFIREEPVLVDLVFGQEWDKHSKEINKFYLKILKSILSRHSADEVYSIVITIFANTGTGKDPLTVRELRTQWRDLLWQGISIIALMENSYPSAKPVIAGVNILGVVSAEDEAYSKSTLPFQSKILTKLMAVRLKLTQESDVWRKYGVDRYLMAFGLSVHPCFREQGLGSELLRTQLNPVRSDDVGLAYQIPVSEHIFTSTASQILATRVGYEVQVEKKYSELLDDEEKVVFPRVNDEFIKVMVKRLY